jgi:hypothetical protein
MLFLVLGGMLYLGFRNTPSFILFCLLWIYVGFIRLPEKDFTIYDSCGMLLTRDNDGRITNHSWVDRCVPKEDPWTPD